MARRRSLPYLTTLLGCVATLILCSATGVTAREGSAASPARDGRLSLPQAVSLALNRNYNIARARLEVSRQEHRRRQAYSDFFPSLDVEYEATGYRYQTVDSKLATAQDSRRLYQFAPNGNIYYLLYPYRIDPYKSVELTATLSQPIFSGGKLLAAYKYAKLGVDSAAIDLEIEKQDLILNVHEAYYKLVRSHKLLKTAQESLAALREQLRQSQAFFKADLVLKVDVLAAQGRIAKALVSKRESEKDIRNYRAALNYLLRFPQEAPIRVVQVYRYEPTSYRIPKIYEIAAANRVEIRKSNISVQRALELVRKSQAALMPTFKVDLEGKRVNDSLNVFDPEGYNDWSISGVLSWTFNTFRSREKVQEDRVKHAQEFVDSENLVTKIMRDVKQAYLDMKRSEGDIKDYKEAMDAFQATYYQNQELYKRQAATYREVLDAEKDLAEAKADYYRALLDYRINRSILERRMGILR